MVYAGTVNDNVANFQVNDRNFARKNEKQKRGRRDISASLLDQKQKELIPGDAEAKRWWRMQPDMRLMDYEADHLDPKIFVRLFKLMLASMRFVPAGCLPDDDDVLADAAGYGKNVAMWLRVKERVLGDIWFLRPDGRWQCAALTEGIIEKVRKSKTSSAKQHPQPDRQQRAAQDSQYRSDQQHQQADLDDDVEF